MVSSLLLYLGMLFLGAIIGHFNLHHKKIDQALLKLQTLALLFILFVMGLRIGNDERVMNALQTIGLRSGALALGSVVFSVLFVWIGRKIVHLGKGVTK